jgi:hypothetical protein
MLRQAHAAGLRASSSLLPRSASLASRLPPLQLQLASAQRRAWLSSAKEASSSASSSAEGSRAAASSSGSSEGAAGSSSEGSAEAEEEAPRADEPFVARASRLIWGTIKLGLGTAVVGGVLYAGYSIVTALLPVGTSSNNIMRKASNILENDPDVLAYFGPIKTYGIDLGGRQEGRRFFVPEYKYEDELTGEG